MRPEGTFDRLPASSCNSLTARGSIPRVWRSKMTRRWSFPTEPDRGHAVEMLAVEPGSTPVGPATLLSVLSPEGLDPGPDGFAVEAIGSDGTVVPLLRIRRFDSDWAEKVAFRDPVRLAEGAAIRVSSRSHPGPDSHADHGHRRGAVGGGSSSPP